MALPNTFGPLNLENLEQLQSEKQKAEEEQVKIAAAITKLMAYPEWQIFASEIKKLETIYNKGPGVYWKNPDQAGFDAGVQFTIQRLLNWCKKQEDLINDEHFAH